MSLLLMQNISLFDMLGNNFIILDEHVNILIRNIKDYNTPIEWNVNKFVPNNSLNLLQLQKYSSANDISNMKITFGSTISSHGIVYGDSIEIDASVKYFLITYELDTSVNVIPYIRDQFNNLIFWRTKLENLLYKKIDGNKHIYLIKIPDLPNTSIEKFKLYLLGYNFIPYSSVTISKLNLVKVQKLPKITINITI